MRYLHFTYLLHVLLGLTVVVSPAGAQPTTIAQADSLKALLRQGKGEVGRVNALLQLSDFYLGKTLDPKRYQDSAMTLARQAGELSRQLAYAKGAEEAFFLVGKTRIQQGNPGSVLAMPESVSDTNRIRLLLELGKSKLRPTYTRNANCDSARVLFQLAERLSEGIGSRKWQEESQALLGVACLLEGDWPGGKAHFMRVIGARRRAGDKAGEIRARLRLAATVWCSDCRENRTVLEEALPLARQTGDRPREALMRLLIGFYQRDAGNARAARREALRALAIQKAVGYPALSQASRALASESVYLAPITYATLSSAYYLLADAYGMEGDLDKRLLYMLEAAKDAERHAMPEELDYANYLLAGTYLELGQLEKSIGYYQQAMAISRRKGQALSVIGGMLSRMTIAMLKAGKADEVLHLLQEITRQDVPLVYEQKTSIAMSFGAYYSATKQYPLAEKHYLEAVAWSKQTNLLRLQNTARFFTGQFYVSAGQYARADPYLKQIVVVPGGFPVNLVLEAHRLRFRVDSAMGHYPSAIRHYQRYTALKDSIFNETQSKQIEQLGVQYETGKKEQYLKLKEKDIALLQGQSKAQQTQRNALIGGTALLLTVLVLVYNRYRLKQRSNQQLEHQQHRLQVQHQELQAQQQVLQAQQKEIHHKNEHLSELLLEKDCLLIQQDTLLGEKEGLLKEKDDLLAGQERLLEEKERLLKEIHHRVRNNLQIVMGLLQSQANFLQDQAALLVIEESQHRIQSMALIHQKLYQGESLARISMQDYIREVVDYLQEYYHLPQPVEFALSVDAIELDVAQAVPLGLIIN